MAVHRESQVCSLTSQIFEPLMTLSSVFLQAKILSKGLILVDLPGIHRHRHAM